MEFPNEDTLCIYHGNCADGFTSAWVVKKYFNEKGLSIDFLAGVYQVPPPDVTGKNVILVDFSYKFPILKAMSERAKSIIILDHHKTAEEDLSPEKIAELKNVKVVFDMEHSGAMITWKQFFPGIDPPQLLRHIEDRDLWLFKLHKTREIQAAVFSYEYTFVNWDWLMYDNLDDLAKEGTAIERKHFKDINELLPICTRHIKIAGLVIPCANLPYTMVSDAGNIMAKQHPEYFGICYYDGMLGRNFSLRSIEGGMDVSEIAKQFGGGGHKHAAGFRVSFEQAKQFEIDQPQTGWNSGRRDGGQGDTPKEG